MAAATGEGPTVQAVVGTAGETIVALTITRTGVGLQAGMEDRAEGTE
eukprot:CAMPEP_0117664668 /NCGR_PEP_ID=MMETSP0804-20121206/9357_1 /TAXON_ID=1074897 /ORGANISM="Tetraselmis astigmatica, Strain CCMP880" /LENGTH=46 /DNA_ID= /DNA_START= /DNA_END= /DNA_ORIENTATION=